METPSPKTLGPYDLAELLGQGGMGAVWRAYHRGLKRWVALKVLTPQGADPNALRRFVREMQLLGRISHPHLVHVLDGGEENGQLYFVMELVEGQTLEALSLEHGAMAWPFALALARGVADGLAHLHEQAVIHRDVKPANVMVSSDGVVKLLDLGIARDTAATAITTAGQMPGTASYLAPEYVRGDPASPANDLWALGLVLYRLLTGQSPIPPGSLDQVLAMILAAPLAAPDEVFPGLPEPVVRITMGLVCRDLRLRTASAAEVRDRIDEVLAAERKGGWEAHLGPGVLARIPKAVRAPARRTGRSAAAPGAVAGAAEPQGSDEATLPLGQQTPTPTAPASGRRTRRTAGTPTSPPRRARLLILVPVCALLLGVVVAVIAARVLREPRLSASPSASPPTSPASTAAPPASPSAAPGPQALPSMPALYQAVTPAAGASAPDRLLDRWKLCEPFLARLKEGAKAREVVAGMRDRVGLDLGPSAATWVHWVELGRWLDADPARRPPPRPAGSLRGPIDWIELSTLRSELRMPKNAPGRGLTSLTLRSLAARPDDGSNWLLLGLVLEHEHRPVEARAIYKLAFDRLEGVELEALDQNHWIALARGILLEGRPLETEWWRYAIRTANGRDWVALRIVLGGCDEALVARVMDAARKRPALDDHAIAWLADMAIARGDLTTARRIWTEGRLRLPQSRYLANLEINYRLARGDLAGVRQELALVPVSKLAAAQVSWLEHPLDPLPPGVVEVHDMYLQLETHRLLTRGEAAAAATFLASPQMRDDVANRTISPALRGRLALDTLGAGGTAISTSALDYLTRSPGVPEWCFGAGALSTPAGQPWFAKALEQARARGEPRLPFDWITAVWHGRSRRPRECAAALRAALAQAPERAVPQELEHVVAELLASPLLALDPALPAPDEKRPPGQLVAHLRAGRNAEALAVARAGLEREPGRALWALALAWLDPKEIPRMELVLRYHGTDRWALAALRP